MEWTYCKQESLHVSNMVSSNFIDTRLLVPFTIILTLLYLVILYFALTSSLWGNPPVNGLTVEGLTLSIIPKGSLPPCFYTRYTVHSSIVSMRFTCQSWPTHQGNNNLNWCTQCQWPLYPGAINPGQPFLSFSSTTKYEASRTVIYMDQALNIIIGTSPVMLQYQPQAISWRLHGEGSAVITLET